MKNNQSQKAGDGATQVQCQNLILQQGIDEKRAHEIYHEQFNSVKKEFTREAISIADSRIREFENRVMHKMQESEERMKTFADPAFQYSLFKAQKTAAFTERITDYELLAELLAHRADQKSDRKMRASINRAIEIVDEISDEALQALTILQTFLIGIRPLTGNIYEGLDIANAIYGQIGQGNLPSGKEWMDQLDILNAIRVYSIGKMIPSLKIISAMFEGYIAIGIRKESEKHTQAIEILNQAGLPYKLFLVEHDFNNSYLRLKIAHKRDIEEIEKLGIYNIDWSNKQKQALYAVYDLYETNEELIKLNSQRLLYAIDQRSYLKNIMSWWDQLPKAFEITSVGYAIACANVQRYSSSIASIVEKADLNLFL